MNKKTSVLIIVAMLFLGFVFLPACSEPIPVTGEVVDVKWSRDRCFEKLKDVPGNGWHLPNDAENVQKEDKTVKDGTEKTYYHYTQKKLVKDGCYSSSGTNNDPHWKNEAITRLKNKGPNEEYHDTTSYQILCQVDGGKAFWKTVDLDQFNAIRVKYISPGITFVGTTDFWGLEVSMYSLGSKK